MMSSSSNSGGVTYETQQQQYAQNPLPRPCRHIRRYVDAWMDGTLRGIAGVFVRQHIARCRTCQKAIAALAEVRDRLRAFGAASREAQPGLMLTDSRRAALEAQWARIAGEAPPPGASFREGGTHRKEPE